MATRDKPSPPNDAPPSDDAPLVIEVPIKLDGEPWRIPLHRPSGRTTIFFASGASLIRTATTLYGVSDARVLVTLYAVWLVSCPILARFFGRKGDRVARLVTGRLGVLGLMAAVAAQTVAHPAVQEPAQYIAPLSGVAIVCGFNLIGEVLTRVNRRSTSGNRSLRPSTTSKG